MLVQATQAVPLKGHSSYTLSWGSCFHLLTSGRYSWATDFRLLQSGLRGLERLSATGLDATPRLLRLSSTGLQYCRFLQFSHTGLQRLSFPWLATAAGLHMLLPLAWHWHNCMATKVVANLTPAITAGLDTLLFTWPLDSCHNGMATKVITYWTLATTT